MFQTALAVALLSVGFVVLGFALSAMIGGEPLSRTAPPAIVGFVVVFGSIVLLRHARS